MFVSFAMASQEEEEKKHKINSNGSEHANGTVVDKKDPPHVRSTSNGTHIENTNL